MRIFLAVFCFTVLTSYTKKNLPEQHTGGNNVNPTIEKIKLNNLPPTNYYQNELIVNHLIINTDLSVFFRSYDTSILRYFSIPTMIPIDEPVQESLSGNTNINYMVNKNAELISILGTLYPATYNSGEMLVSDDLVAFAGVLELYFQLGSNATTLNRNIPWSCIYEAIAGTIGIASMIEDYRALVRSGGSWSSARSLIWRMIKRYAGWWTAGALIYKIVTDCF